MEMYGLAGHCFYWAAFSFFLHKVSFFCSCSADLSIDAKCDLRSSKEGISTFCFSGCKHDWLLLLWNYHPSFFSQSSPSLTSGFRSFCLCFGQAFGPRDSYFSSSTFTRDIYSWGHIVLMLATRHLMCLAQPLGHVFVAFTGRWKFGDSW